MNSRLLEWEGACPGRATPALLEAAAVNLTVFTAGWAWARGHICISFWSLLWGFWLIWKLWKEGVWPLLGLRDPQVTAALSQRAGGAAESVPSCPICECVHIHTKYKYSLYINILFSTSLSPGVTEQVAHPLAVFTLVPPCASGAGVFGSPVAPTHCLDPGAPTSIISKAFWAILVPCAKGSASWHCTLPVWQGRCSQRYASAREKWNLNCFLICAETWTGNYEPAPFNEEHCP